MDLNAVAVKVKDSALLWVYVIEWFTVSASAMIASSFLHIIIVKRRLSMHPSDMERSVILLPFPPYP